MDEHALSYMQFFTAKSAKNAKILNIFLARFAGFAV